MRTITYFFILNLIIICLGCEQEYITIYTLKNESGKSIKINTYSSSNRLNNEIIINEKNSFSRETVDYQGSPSSFYRVFESEDNSSIDSITIIYDNSKISAFNFSTNNKRNPLLFHADNTFTFTEEDYENAEDCNGNCE
jgi:hypothetical protein